MNKALLKATFKANHVIFIIFFLVLLMYSMIIVGMFDPNNMGAWESMLELFSREMLDAMGFMLLEQSLFGFIGGYLYGFIMLMFPMIYIVVLGPRMIVKYVDSGSMSFLLSTPNTRKKIAVTQGFYMAMSIISLIIVVVLLNLLFSVSMFPGELDIPKYLLMNLNLIAFLSLLGGINFITSCIFNETRLASAFGAGFSIGFFLINMLSDVSKDLDFLKYITIFTLFEPMNVLENIPLVYIHTIILFISSISLYLIGIYVFKKKDLHI